MISNSLTFALGPKFLDCPDDVEAASPKDPLHNQEDAEDLESQEEEAVETNEQTSLLPQNAARSATHTGYSLLARCKTAFASLPTFVQQTISFLTMFGKFQDGYTIGQRRTLLTFSQYVSPLLFCERNPGRNSSSTMLASCYQASTKPAK